MTQHRTSFLTFWLKFGRPRPGDIVPPADSVSTESAPLEAASSRTPLVLYPHVGRLRAGCFLLSACVALYGGWHWFGNSGVGLVALWLQMRRGVTLAATESAGGGEVSLDLDQVIWVRVDPWRVTVALSSPSAGVNRAEVNRAEVNGAGVNGAGFHSPRMGLKNFRRRRVEFFRDELDATHWAQLRRSLLEVAAPKQRARTPGSRTRN